MCIYVSETPSFQDLSRRFGTMILSVKNLFVLPQIKGFEMIFKICVNL